MKAMILAAGRGQRMRELTDHCPKPLLTAAGKSLIEYSIERLQKAGYTSVVINTHYLASNIHTALGDGSQFGIDINYSNEIPVALETGGGIFQALPLLGTDPFLVINSDVWCSHSLTAPSLGRNSLAHLVLVKNPAHNTQGDFFFSNGKIEAEGTNMYTFSGIGWYRPELFKGQTSGAFPLAPLLRQAIKSGQVSGEIHNGEWMDIGTPERLKDLNEQLKL